MSGSSTYVPARKLEDFCSAILQKAGCPADHARQTARCLVDANLEGVDTHGVARIAVYARRVAGGAINAKPAISILHRRGGLATIDGDNGLGPVVGQAATQHSIALAREFGIGWVLARNSNHYAHSGYYAAMAAREGMIGLSSSSGEPLVAPWGGTRPFFTNNPLAIAAPCGDELIVIDMATSVAARGQILLAARTGQSIPTGWAVDANGEPTTDPHAALAGAVLPMAGPKGYALILGLEILTGVLAGGEFAPRVGSQHNEAGRASGIGQFFGAIDPSALMTADEFAGRMKRLLHDLRTAPRSLDVDVIRVPGDRRAANRRERLKTGIPLPPAIMAELQQLAAQFNLPQEDRLDE